MILRRFACLALVVCLAVPAFAQTTTPEWVKRSNANAQILLEIFARISPESAARLGVEGFDSEITQLPSDLDDRFIAPTEQAIAKLEAKRTSEKDQAVREDLDILINAAREAIEGRKLARKYEIPYFNLSMMIFQGTRSLLDDQVAAERRPAALVRLKKYAGLESGFTPITTQAMAYTRSRLGNGALIGPFKDKLEKDLSNSDRYMNGIEQLFKKYNIAGYETPLAELRKQIAGYNAFLRAEVLPRATTDFRQPEELYVYSLRTRGIDMPVEELISRAKTSFREIQNEMRVIAPMVAKEKGLSSSDYRDVIRDLKKKQFVGAAILPHYEQRIKDLEAIIRDNAIVTLPNRPAQFRLASEAETAVQPAPNMEMPRLIGNKGERGTFVLPLRVIGPDGKDLAYDDFTFEAASWTLTAHEGRPGHELQFASMIEHGVSTARALFAINSVNAEGWALYAEAEVKPYEPLDGQLIALQHRLLRAARAFLDPSLQLGRMTREEAYRVLENDVVLSKGMATQEVERYTFNMPGQAPSYFVGYSRLMELRTDAERIIGKNFDRQSYHDYILAQGVLPPRLLRDAVMNGYVKPRAAAPQAVEKSEK